MIWHIFKKDWKLLWWQALAVVALATGSILADLRNGYFGGADPTTTRAEMAFGVLAFVAGLFLVTELIQLDPIPGGAQDWLVRPVKRIDLILAKILFIVLALEAPMLVVTVVTELAQGFTPGTSLSGAAMDALSTTLLVGLPALAFASLFRGVTETVAATFAVVLALMAGGFFLMGKANFPLVGPASGTDVQWVADVSESTVYFLGAVAVLAIQYLRRWTTRARWVAAVVFALARLAPLMPWQTAFAVQQRLAPAHGAAASVALAFDPAAGGASPVSCIPLTVSGLPAHSWLNVDSLSASLIDAKGSVIWKTRLSESAKDSSSPFNSMRGRYGCQPVPMEASDIKRFADAPALRVRLDYSLTLFGVDKTYAMPTATSSDSDQILPDVGRCRTKVGERVDLGCLTQQPPTCAMAFLEDKTTGTRSPPVYSCAPDYDPWTGGDVSNWGSGLSIPWRNLTDQKINNWQFVLRTYKPLDHFSRQITTPEIKLRDWLPRS